MARERSHLTWRGVFSQFTAHGGQISALKQYLRDTRCETGCHLRRMQDKGGRRKRVIFSICTKTTVARVNAPKRDDYGGGLAEIGHDTSTVPGDV